MSEISKYKTKLLGYITCPSDYELIDGSISPKIPIYILEENIPPEETDFDGKAGDIILGGGGGKADVLRISLPEAENYLQNNEDVFFQSPMEVFKSFWHHNLILRLANGFTKVGWNFNQSSLEMWLTRQILGWIGDKYPKYLHNGSASNHRDYKNDLFSFSQ